MPTIVKAQAALLASHASLLHPRHQGQPVLEDVFSGDARGACVRALHHHHCEGQADPRAWVWSLTTYRPLRSYPACIFHTPLVLPSPTAMLCSTFHQRHLRPSHHVITPPRHRGHPHTKVVIMGGGGASMPALHHPHEDGRLTPRAMSCRIISSPW